MAGVDEQGGGRARGMSRRSLGTGGHRMLGVYSKYEEDPLGEYSGVMGPDPCNNPHPSSCWLESRLEGESMNPESENTSSPIKVHFFLFQLSFDHSDHFMESLSLELLFNTYLALAV